VKNERALWGYIWFGAMRTATFSAYAESPLMGVQLKEKLKRDWAYHQDGQDRIVVALFTFYMALQDPRNRLSVSPFGGNKFIIAPYSGFMELTRVKRTLYAES